MRRGMVPTEASNPRYERVQVPHAAPILGIIMQVEKVTDIVSADDVEDTYGGRWLVGLLTF